MAATFDAVAFDVRQPAVLNPTWSHTIGSGATLIVICTSLRSGVSDTVTTVTVGIQAATKIGSSYNGGVPNAEIWALLNPTSGAQTVSVLYSGIPSQKSVQGSTSYFGTTSPLPTTVTAVAGSATSTSVSRSCSIGDLIVDACAVQTNIVDTPGSAPQVEAYAASNTTSAYIRGMSSYVLDAAGTSQAISYTWGGGNLPRAQLASNFSPAAAAKAPPPYDRRVRRNTLLRM